jgi:hypothetical protein
MGQIDFSGREIKATIEKRVVEGGVGWLLTLKSGLPLGIGALPAYGSLSRILAIKPSCCAY